VETEPSDECRAFRLIRPDWVREDQGVERPTSQAFTDSAEDGKLSVFLEDEIRAARKSPGCLLGLPEFPGYRLCWIRVGALRSLDQLIERDPQPIFPGHALVSNVNKGKRPLTTRRKIAIAVEWWDEADD
jgi:hypothetical protein